MINSPTLLSVRNLTVKKGRSVLLDDVSFDAPAQWLTGVFGESGAGKSTMLNTLAGIQDPTFEVTGSIRVAGEEIGKQPPEHRSLAGLAIVRQDVCLFPDLLVLDNVAYPLRRRGVRREEARARAREVLSAFHIDELVERYPSELSGGQQQRVALARATAYSPRLLLLDEPFKGLEQDLREQLLAVIRLQALRGTGILMAAHERRDLQLAADSIIEVRQGRVLGVEIRSETSGGEVFETIRRRVLVPDLANRGLFFRARTLNLSHNGTSHPVGGSDGISISATVLEHRCLGDGRFACLLDYGAGQVGWAEVDSSHLLSLHPGAVVTVTCVRDGERQNAIQ